MNYNAFGFSTPRALALATVAGTILLGVASGVFGTFSKFPIGGQSCTGNIYGYDYGYGYGYGYNCVPTVLPGSGGGSSGGNPISTPTPSVNSGSGTTQTPPSEKPPVVIPKAKDIADSPFKTSIEILISKGVVKNSAVFNPEKSITRAEFVKMLAKAYGYEKTTKIKKRFKDVNYRSDLALYINFGVEMGWINVRNTNFRPNDSITRGEAQKLIDVINGNASADTIAEPTANVTRAEAADMIVKGILDNN